jgi:hypothetical protein
MPQSLCNKDIDENSPEGSQCIIGAYVLKLFFNLIVQWHLKFQCWCVPSTFCAVTLYSFFIVRFLQSTDTSACCRSLLVIPILLPWLLVFRHLWHWAFLFWVVTNTIFRRNKNVCLNWWNETTWKWVSFYERYFGMLPPEPFATNFIVLKVTGIWIPRFSWQWLWKWYPLCNVIAYSLTLNEGSGNFVEWC